MMHFMTWLAIPLAGITVLSTLCGGLTALRLRRELTTAIALTGGIVVAVALFDVLPEAIKSVDDPRRVTALVGAGFLAFFLAERLLVLHHRDETEQRSEERRVGKECRSRWSTYHERKKQTRGRTDSTGELGCD